MKVGFEPFSDFGFRVWVFGFPISVCCLHGLNIVLIDLQDATALSIPGLHSVFHVFFEAKRMVELLVLGYV